MNMATVVQVVSGGDHFSAKQQPFRLTMRNLGPNEVSKLGLNLPQSGLAREFRVLRSCRINNSIDLFPYL
jgi:hypothetical protein